MTLKCNKILLDFGMGSRKNTNIVAGKYKNKACIASLLPNHKIIVTFASVSAKKGKIMYHSQCWCFSRKR